MLLVIIVSFFLYYDCSSIRSNEQHILHQQGDTRNRNRRTQIYDLISSLRNLNNTQSQAYIIIRDENRIDQSYLDSTPTGDRNLVCVRFLSVVGHQGKLNSIGMMMMMMMIYRICRTKWKSERKRDRDGEYEFMEDNRSNSIHRLWDVL